MKKLLVLPFMLSLAMALAAGENEAVENETAENEGIGLSAGLEFGIGNINKADGGDREPYLMPMLIYDRSFFDGSLDIYAELDYTFGFARTADDDGKQVFPQSLYFDLILSYNLGLGGESTLSLILENEFDEFIISPRSKESNALTGILTPAVKFTQGFDFGDLFAQIGVPVTYIQYEKDADSEVGLDFTLGWNSSFGLGIEAKVLTLLKPAEDRGYLGFEALFTYETETFYCEILAEFPRNIGGTGITITPEFDYFFGNFTFYAKCEFAGIGVDGGGLSVSPALGIKYTF